MSKKSTKSTQMSEECKSDENQDNQSLVDHKPYTPPQYSDNIYPELIEAIANGGNIVSLTKEARYPSFVSFYKWLNKSIENLQLYEQAKQIRSHYVIEETLEISDTCDDNVAKAALQLKARTHYASKVNPQAYGDSSTLRLADNEGNKLTLSNIIDQID